MVREKCALLTLLLITTLGHTGPARAEEVTSRGGFALSAGGSLSSTGFSIGGSAGYFVTDHLLPGIRYTFSLVRHDDPYYYRALYHDAGLFLRYYLPHLERVYPFVVGEPGYHAFSITEEYATGEDTTERMSTRGHYFTAYAGAGAVFMLTAHLGIEPNVGLRKELGSGEGPVLDWWVGLGLYP